MQYLVTVIYHEDKPKLSPWANFYMVNAENVYEARFLVREQIGYDPGVPCEVTQVPINKNHAHKFCNLGGWND